MTRIYVCPECGQYNGHFAGCPEDVWPDEDDAGPDDDKKPDVDTADEAFERAFESGDARLERLALIDLETAILRNVGKL